MVFYQYTIIYFLLDYVFFFSTVSHEILDKMKGNITQFSFLNIVIINIYIFPTFYLNLLIYMKIFH